MTTRFLLAALVAAVAIHAQTTAPAATFQADLAFLKQHTKVLVLSDASGAQVVVAPEYQGRVMTSTTGGPNAPGFGWIGRAAVASGKRQPHMNVFGGEDRFWLGPEGGQFALYFKRGEPFDVDHWQTPEPFDWGAWTVAAQSASSARFTKHMDLVNYAGAPFSIDVDRTVRLLGTADAAAHLGIKLPAGVRMVAFESANTVVNAGKNGWQPDKGLVSIWILGQFTPSPSMTVAIPFAPGPESALGPIVHDAYFGKVPPDRLTIAKDVIRFRADGKYRSKIGVPPPRALPIAGSYDSARHVLTLVQYTKPAAARDYVNSMWEMQREPYRGDVVNSYNDGPLGPGQPGLGPFYEVETSSPALRLGPGARYTHVHRTFHFAGTEADLDTIARATLKIALADLASTFTR